MPRFRIASVSFAMLTLGSSSYADVALKQSMASLYKNVSDLLPLVVDKKSFEDPKNRKFIATHMNQLKELSTLMTSENKKFSDNDPSIGFITDRFAEDIQYAITLWNTGDRVIPRRILRGTTDYCISCHTRTGRGAMFTDLNAPKKFASLPKSVKAEYFLATRQYNNALVFYEKILMDGALAKLDPDAWSQSLKKLLAITVRVKGDPSLTLEMISRIQERPEAATDKWGPAIAEWRKTAVDWVNESKGAKTQKQTSLAALQSDFEVGERIEAKTPEGGLIHFLKASESTHELLGKVKPKDQDAELLLLAGRSASHLGDINLGMLQEVYFERCVLASGQKSAKGECLNLVEKAYLKNYGAEIKSSLPEHIQYRLRHLKSAFDSAR